VSAEENVRNILRGIEVLQAAGIEPSGFAAPHGRFNAGLLEALTALRITHSSEFGLAYDDLPFLVGTGPLLQIPVHPVCLGLVLEAAARKNNAHAPPHWNPAQIILEHWEQLARKCCATGMPLFLYGHPTGRLGRYPQVLRHAIRIASESPAFWKTTFTELDRWWRARAGVTLTVHREQDCCVIAAGSLPPHHRLAVEYWRGDRVAVMPLDGPVYRFSPASLAFEVRRSAPAVRPVRIDQPGGLRGRIRRWVDWERVTPTEEIPANSLPNVTKRVLRRLLCYPKRGQDPSVHVASPYPAKDTQGS
jgi:hypothetical protein